MKLIFNTFLVLTLALISQLTFAQDRKVSGLVSDESGLPIPGANILVKGTTNGIQTDFDGKFQIMASADQILVFSYIGMVNQEVAATTTDLKVKLKMDAVQLEGVVITALGIKREKKSLGYATQEVSGDLLNQGGQNNAISALSGNVAGLQVTAPSSMGGSSRIIMRGIGSVTGENKPLIVIDGIPLDNSNYNSAEGQRGGGGRDYGDATADINPDDIESVTVLKGGPAAALYGNRAGNGAILYTTKSAKKGKGVIEFNSGITLESINIMPTLQNSYGGGNSTTFGTANIGGKNYNVADYGTDESWGPKYNSTLKYLPWNAFDPEFSNDYLKEKSWVAPKNDVRSFFRTGITRNNSISFMKATEESNIRISYANQSSEGIVPNSTLDKNTFSFNASTKITDKFKVEAMANYALTKGFNRPEQGYGDNSLGQKFFQWGQRQLDYNELKEYKLANGNQRAWNRIGFDNATANYQDNPYWIINENTSEDTRSRLFGNTKFTYNITDELYAVGNVYADTYTLRTSERVAIGSQAQSSYTDQTRTLSDYNYEGRIHFDKNLSKFSINSFVGANRRSYSFSSIKGETIGGLVLPGLYNLSNSAEQAKATNEQKFMRTNSLYGFASVGYDNMLYLEVTDRNDWFSTTSKPVNYASATGSFVFSKLTNSNWLDFGKLRAGWAQAGNSTTPYRLENYATISTPFQGDPRYSSALSSNNANLVPELKTTKEIGLELSLFKKRINLDVSYYDVITTDLITPIQVESSTGFTSKLINAGKLQNKGIETTLNINPIRTDDFRWDITWNFAKNDNKLIELYEDVTSLQLAQAPFRARLLAVVGEKYGQIYGTDFVYDANGKKLVGPDGNFVASAQKSLGSVIPDYNMGIRNTFRYKNFGLNVLIDIQKGGSYFSTSHMYGTYSGMLENTVENGIRENGIVNEGVLADGSANTKNIAARTWAQAFSNTVDAQNVFDADYIKLRDVSLSYSLPIKKESPFSSIKFSFYGRNLFAWGLAWKGMDPEMASYGSGNTQGIEGGSLPSTRTYGMNVEFKF